jgi:hypothetical protein
MSDEDRQRLAAEQSRLVEALAARGATPDDFDTSRVDLAARTLFQKRVRTIDKIWPGLIEGAELSFDAYAKEHSIPAAGPVADAMAFAEYLLARGGLCDELRVGLVLRRAARGWPVRWVRLSETRRIVLALRIPRLGVRMLSLPFWFR